MIPLGASQRERGVAWMTYALIAANCYAFWREANAREPERLISGFATIPYDVTHHIVLAPPSPPNAYLTLITAQFMHASVLHLVSNMLFLFVFGPEVERLCGSFRYLFFYLICGLVGNVAQVAVMPGSHVPSIGASGAIAGVLGAFLVCFPLRPIAAIVPIGFIPLFLRIPAWLVIGFWAALQFVHGFGVIDPRALSEQGGGVAYFTHIGGFLCGVILIEFVRREGTRERIRYYP